MVFGFGKGKLYLTVDKDVYQPGEMITGKVDLQLKKHYTARDLTVRLLGQEVTRRQVRDSNGRYRTQESRRTFCDESVHIGGEGEYQIGQWPFQLLIPTDALQRVARPGGAIGGSMAFGDAMSGRRVEWFVKGQLDLPMKLDVSDKKYISIRGRDQGKV